MSKKHDKHHCEEEYEEEFEEDSSLTSLEGYIEASEMYLEALKLTDEQANNAGYVVGMTAVYFGKAFLAFTDTNNTEAMKGSLREAIGAYSAAASFCESNGIAKQFVYTARLIIEELKNESKNF